MPLCYFRTDVDDVRLFGLIEGERVIPLHLVDGPATLAEALQLRSDELQRSLERARTVDEVLLRLDQVTLAAPIDEQEVWAAGVTYQRSREARMEESTQKDVYDLVYEAERPEIFFKATPSRVVGPDEAVAIRGDSTWDVPEPELALVINRHAEVVGYTAGNDVSSRSIEGENPLYLPQAKLYTACAALGPAIALAWEVDTPDALAITLTIERDGADHFTGETSTSQLHRSFGDLVTYLHRHNEFPHGVVLMTGTGIIPPAEFTLEDGDVVRITVEGIGTLRNPVKRLPRS
jgi:2-dehydro-3-deoxy-D-arabinonate dehydratase